MQDGYAPKVTPFVLPSAASQRFNSTSVGGNGSQSSGNESNHAYAGLPHIQSNNLYHPSDNYSPTSPNGIPISSAYGTTASPHSTSQYLYSPTPSTHPLLPHPPNPNHQQSNPNLNSTYHSTSGSISASSNGNSPHQNYNNANLPPLPVNSRTGLANPDDFEYRDSRNGY